MQTEASWLSSGTVYELLYTLLSYSRHVLVHYIFFGIHLSHLSPMKTFLNNVGLGASISRTNYVNSAGLPGSRLWTLPGRGFAS